MRQGRGGRDESQDSASDDVVEPVVTEDDLIAGEFGLQVAAACWPMLAADLVKCPRSRSANLRQSVMSTASCPKWLTWTVW